MHFLGTGAGKPTNNRNVTSIALNLLPERGTCWLFDCGEGTQQQLLKTSLKISKFDKLFVTHLHGDHIFGIPGLLTSRSYGGSSRPFTVYGPPGIREFVEIGLRISQSHIDYELDIVEYSEGTVFCDDSFTVTAGKLEHRIDSYGFRITEHDRTGSLDVEALKRIGIRPGPVLGMLKRGETVTLEDGRVIHGTDYVAPSIRGRKVAVLGDTRYTRQSLELARGADLLVHEATFGSEHADLAESYYHSTAEQAARIAAEAGARRLVLTHISSRYDDAGTGPLLEEAQAIFADTHAAVDFARYEIASGK
jgi:ribonuclease Z